MPSHEDTAMSALGRLRGALSPRNLAEALIAGGGGFLAIFLLAWTGSILSLALLIAPFGSSCVLVFALPQSPLAQPRNVIGGHLVATIAGFVAQMVFGPTSLGLAFGVGLAIASMVVTKTVHPPAGADPIVVLLTSAALSFLAVPMLLGTVTIVLIGIAYHRAVSGKAYPAAQPKSPAR